MEIEMTTLKKKGVARPACIAGYMRVSTNKQGLKGLGMDAQKEIIDNYVLKEHPKCVDNIKLFIEQESGSKGTKKRPQLKAAFDYCAENNCKLVVAKMDRLSRSVSFISGILDSGIEFSIAEVPGLDSKSPMGKAMLQMMATMAELERSQVQDRTKQSLSQINRRIDKKGHYITKGVPEKGIAGRKITRLGADNVKPGARAAAKVRADAAKLYLEKNAQNIDDVIKVLGTEGKSSLRDIAQALTDRGQLTPREWQKEESTKDTNHPYKAKVKKWQASMVANIKKSMEQK